MEIFEKLYESHPEKFNSREKQDYAWVIFRIHVKGFKTEEELTEHAELITQLVDQKDLRAKDLSCVYTSAVFEMLKHYGSRKDYQSMLCWFDKINPEFLNDFPYVKDGKTYKSKREVFLDFASNAYYQLGYDEECIEVSKMALDTDHDLVEGYWMNWRCGRSLKFLKRYSEAIPYLKRAVRDSPEWHIHKDIAECYCMLGQPLEALKQVCSVIFDEASNSEKVEVYYLTYRILKGFNEKQAINHAKFYFLLKSQSGAAMPYEILQMNFDENDIDESQLESEIMEIWREYREYLKIRGEQS